MHCGRRRRRQVAGYQSGDWSTHSKFMGTFKQKTCARCGKDFGCGAEADQGSCWCVDLTPVPLTSISSGDCLCPSCLTHVIQAILQSHCLPQPLAQNSLRADQPVFSANEPEVDSPGLLVEGEDYYSEGGLIVFTASYHLRRGYCCDSGCRHCPYEDV
jgi:uncharacterized protein DUF5522/cysteine-rich CWC protein